MRRTLFLDDTGKWNFGYYLSKERKQIFYTSVIFCKRVFEFNSTVTTYGSFKFTFFARTKKGFWKKGKTKKLYMFRISGRKSRWGSLCDQLPLSGCRNKSDRSDLEDHKGKAPDAPEKVQNGVYTMLIVPVIIEILAVAGIILLIIRIHCSKR